MAEGSEWVGERTEITAGGAFLYRFSRRLLGLLVLEGSSPRGMEGVTPSLAMLFALEGMRERLETSDSERRSPVICLSSKDIQSAFVHRMISGNWMVGTLKADMGGLTAEKPEGHELLVLRGSKDSFSSS